MNFQQKVAQAKDIMQQIANDGGKPYFPDTFNYDRGIGWMVEVDYAQEIEWQDFNYVSHETGMTVYRNLNEVIEYLRSDLAVLVIKNNPTEETMMWGGDEQGYVFIGDSQI